MKVKERADCEHELREKPGNLRGKGQLSEDGGPGEGQVCRWEEAPGQESRFQVRLWRADNSAAGHELQAGCGFPVSLKTVETH